MWWFKLNFIFHLKKCNFRKNSKLLTDPFIRFWIRVATVRFWCPRSDIDLIYSFIKCLKFEVKKNFKQSPNEVLFCFHLATYLSRTKIPKNSKNLIKIGSMNNSCINKFHKITDFLLQYRAWSIILLDDFHEEFKTQDFPLHFQELMEYTLHIHN